MALYFFTPKTFYTFNDRLVLRYEISAIRIGNFTKKI